jgi:hypothetical protein
MNSDEFNLQLLHQLQQDGRIFISSTRLNHQCWLRVAVLNAMTHREHIDLALELLRDKSLSLASHS